MRLGWPVLHHGGGFGTCSWKVALQAQYTELPVVKLLHLRPRKRPQRQISAEHAMRKSVGHDSPAGGEALTAGHGPLGPGAKAVAT